MARRPYTPLHERTPSQRARVFKLRQAAAALTIAAAATAGAAAPSLVGDFKRPYSFHNTVPYTVKPGDTVDSIIANEEQGSQIAAAPLGEELTGYRDLLAAREDDIMKQIPKDQHGVLQPGEEIMIPEGSKSDTALADPSSTGRG